MDISMCKDQAANIFDGKAARMVIKKLFSRLDTVKKIWADGGYSGKELSEWVKRLSEN